MNRKALAIFLLAPLVGCSTPQPVRDLAAHGAVLSDQADRETRAFLARAERAQAARSAAIESLAERDVRLDQTLQFNGWIAKQAGMPDAQPTIDLIRGLAEQSRKTREATQAAVADTRKKFEVKPISADATSQALANTKKSFTVLAQELSPQEWAAFSWKYLNQVRDAYRDSGDKAASAAP